MSSRTVYTIGYEGRSLDDFMRALLDAGVKRVVDVRALPLSRRRGFSKTALAAELERRGIEYVHLKSAGNPFRDLKDDPERCLALYRAHLAQHPEVLKAVDGAVSGAASALLCFEAEPADCHRSVIAAQLARRVRNL